MPAGPAAIKPGEASGAAPTRKAGTWDASVGGGGASCLGLDEGLDGWSRLTSGDRRVTRRAGHGSHRSMGRWMWLLSCSDSSCQLASVPSVQVRLHRPVQHRAFFLVVYSYAIDIVSLSALETSTSQGPCKCIKHAAIHAVLTFSFFEKTLSSPT